jgi:hypothetical protein
MGGRGREEERESRVDSRVVKGSEFKKGNWLNSRGFRGPPYPNLNKTCPRLKNNPSQDS